MRQLPTRYQVSFEGDETIISIPTPISALKILSVGIGSLIAFIITAFLGRILLPYFTCNCAVDKLVYLFSIATLIMIGILLSNLNALIWQLWGSETLIWGKDSLTVSRKNDWFFKTKVYDYADTYDFKVFTVDMQIENYMKPSQASKLGKICFDYAPSKLNNKRYVGKELSEEEAQEILDIVIERLN